MLDARFRILKNTAHFISVPSESSFDCAQDGVCGYESFEKTNPIYLLPTWTPGSRRLWINIETFVAQNGSKVFKKCQKSYKNSHKFAKTVSEFVSRRGILLFFRGFFEKTKPICQSEHMLQGLIV